MANSINMVQLVLVVIGVISFIVAKYFNTIEYFSVSKAFLIVIIILCIIFHKNIKRIYGNQLTLGESLIKISQFIIITGVLAVITAMILRPFIPELQ